VASVACLLGAAAVPLARGDEAFREAGVRVAAVALLALVAAIVLGWASFVPIAVALVGGIYAAELAIADAPLDAATPGLAVVLLLSVELAYWSLDERYPIPGDPGEGLRRVAFLAVLGVAAAIAAAVLLVLVDAVRARSLAVDVVGSAAAVAVLLTVLLVARRTQNRAGDSA
jgi:hypothetical protein